MKSRVDRAIGQFRYIQATERNLDRERESLRRKVSELTDAEMFAYTAVTAAKESVEGV